MHILDLISNSFAEFISFKRIYLILTHLFCTSMRHPPWILLFLKYRSLQCFPMLLIFFSLIHFLLWIIFFIFQLHYRQTNLFLQTQLNYLLIFILFLQKPPSLNLLRIHLIKISIKDFSSISLFQHCFHF